MNTRVLIKVAAESILKNKMRTVLTMLGIVIGVGAVIVMVAIGSGAQAQIQAQIDNLGTNMLVVTPGSSQQGGVSMGAGSLNRLTLDDAEKLERESLLVTDVSPVIITRVQALAGSTNWRTEVNGVAPSYERIRDWTLSDGVFFTEADVRANRAVAVLGRTVANQLFPNGDALGQRIQLRDVPFTVVGVLAAKGQTATGADQDDVVIVPYTTMQNRLSGSGFLGQILGATATSEDIAPAQEEIRAILRESHRLAVNELDDFTVRNQSEIAEAAKGTTQVMTALLAAIASVSLIVGGIGIMNIMLVSVTERTREIGIRMAIGGRGSDVLRQFLVESVVMSLAGGVLGLALGIGSAALVSNLTGWHAVTPAWAALLAVGFSAAVGIFFGFYPARKASRLNPIEALRYE